MMNDSYTKPKRSIFIGTGVVLALMVWFAFGPALQYGFINFDDPGYVYKNSAVSQGLTRESVTWAFTHRHGGNWHPLTFLSHMLDCQLFGLHPAGHHATNLLLHTAAALLLFAAVYRLSGFIWRSAVVAALFAVHPLRVESVVWISERKDVLSGLFFMLTLLAYIRYVRKPFLLRRYLPVLLFFALGLLSKPMLVTLPAVLLLLDFWPLGRRDFSSGQFVSVRQLVAEKIPLFLFSGLSCISTFWAQEHALTMIHVPFFFRVCNAVVSYAVYLKQLVYPFQLALVYPHPETHLALWKVALSLLLLIGISIWVWMQRKNHPWLLMGWLWYVGMLAPVIGVVQVGVQAHADRYTYLPQIGLYIALVWSVAESLVFRGRFRRIWQVCLLAALPVVLMITQKQTVLWRSNLALWSHAIECTDKNTTALVNLGAAFFDEGEAEAAAACFSKALEISPDDATALYNSGYLMVSCGVLDEGIVRLRRAVQQDPGYGEARKALGAALLLSGQISEGLEQSREALKLCPDDTEILRNIKVGEEALKKPSGSVHGL